jgi:hypothetical protein
VDGNAAGNDVCRGGDAYGLRRIVLSAIGPEYSGHIDGYGERHGGIDPAVRHSNSDGELAQSPEITEGVGTNRDVRTVCRRQTVRTSPLAHDTSAAKWRAAVSVLSVDVLLWGLSYPSPKRLHFRLVPGCFRALSFLNLSHRTEVSSQHKFRVQRAPGKRGGGERPRFTPDRIRPAWLK